MYLKNIPPLRLDLTEFLFLSFLEVKKYFSSFLFNKILKIYLFWNFFKVIGLFKVLQKIWEV